MLHTTTLITTAYMRLKLEFEPSIVTQGSNSEFEPQCSTQGSHLRLVPHVVCYMRLKLKFEPSVAHKAQTQV